MIVALILMLIPGGLLSLMIMRCRGAVVMQIVSGNVVRAYVAIHPCGGRKAWLPTRQQQEDARDERAQHHAYTDRAPDHLLFRHVFASKVKKANANVNALPPG